MTIRNPLEWGVDELRISAHAVGAAGRGLRRPDAAVDHTMPRVRRIGIADLTDALAKGFSDFGAYRSDVIFISLIYPLAGLVLGQLLLGYEALPLLFPLVSGFALIGPFAAAGLYEASRRREMGHEVSWHDSFGVFQSPAFGSIAMLGIALVGVFLLWMLSAMVIYWLTFGMETPASFTGFVEDVFTTSRGWALIALGVGTGFCFAVFVLAISVVSFPLLLDRNVSVLTAVQTSVRAVRQNPVPMMLWGLIVAGSLALGALPALVGLIVVMPVLGHATWHLYRKVVE
jgi:uncharacterized membrane protein